MKRTAIITVEVKYDTDLAKELDITNEDFEEAILEGEDSGLLTLHSNLLGRTIGPVKILETRIKR